MKLRPRRLLWDIETTGLLDQLATYINDPIKSRCHILAIRDLDTRETFVFRRNAEEDTIRDGIKMLNEAEFLVGHNILSFDMAAMWLLYGEEFNPTGTIRDSLIMCRMLFADEKEKDYRRAKRGQLEGRLIGRQGLEAWGQRLGFPKDDYSKRRKALAAEQWHADSNLHNHYVDLDEYAHWITWGQWNQEMEDYCVCDLDVNEELWRKIDRIRWSDQATILEHRVSELMDRVEANGFPFHLPRARALEANLRETHDKIAQECIQHFGQWWAPKRWRIVDKEDSKGESFEPRAEYGEDDSRQSWGNIVVPSRDIRYKDHTKSGGDRVAGAAFCPIQLKEFNPNSRPQIIDRLSKVHGWEPQEFTEEGNPKVDDEVLRDLARTIPICNELAELFYYKKRLGQLVDGKNGLIKKAEERGDSKIHPTINVGGTVTNRASHSNPNIAQVPRVTFKKLLQWIEEGVEVRFKGGKFEYGIPGTDKHGRPTWNTKLTPLLDPFGKQLVGIPVRNKETGDYVFDVEGKVKTKPTLLKGREGNHGWDFRNLFYVPEGWVLMGSDMAGIELRALAHFMFPYDQGTYRTLVVEGDVHTLHQQAMEIDSRDTAKTVIYALIYGAQDYKLGITVDPSLTLYPVKAKALGAEVRRRLMAKIPALAAVVKAVQREARQGAVEAMDGRELFVRAKHSALNTKLQGCGATLAKQWCVLFEEYMENAGYSHGWDGDFAILAWVHDELQVAVRDDPQIKADAQRLITQAALDAGVIFEFACRVDVGVQFGTTWATTH